MIERVRAALARHAPAYAIRTVARLGEGGKNVAYDVNGELVVRVRKDAASDDGGLLVEDEAALLAAVAKVSTLPAPAVMFAEADAGILAYRKLPGVPLLEQTIAEPITLAPALGAFLSRLHAAPVAMLERLVPRDDDGLADWLDRAADEYAHVAR